MTQENQPTEPVQPAAEQPAQVPAPAAAEQPVETQTAAPAQPARQQSRGGGRERGGGRTGERRGGRGGRGGRRDERDESGVESSVVRIYRCSKVVKGGRTFSFGALVVAALHRRLNWVALYEASLATLKATAMVMWIFFGATMFVGFFIVKGGQTFVSDLILATGLAPYGILFLMMTVLFILGMFLDWVGILLLTVPIFLPIMKSLPFDGAFGLPGVAPGDVALWYGVIFMVNMQMAFLSPPFGYSLFYLKSVAPPQISMAMIFRSAIPFIGLQIVGLTLCIVFPGIILWLPKLLYAGHG